jgi:acetoin:2,6-dichlorophenolindophenol oxidoreductase subunit beta
LKSINNSLFRIFEEFDNSYLIGEDIEDPYGGAFKVTAGLHYKFPTRVITSPISESALVGVANGMALRGMRPLVEIMFGDFLTLCIDQIVNHSSKFVKMYGTTLEVPILIRTPMGGGRGYGPTHSQSLEKLLMGIPYVKVIAPSVFHSPGDILFNVVKNSKTPTVFIENKLLYNQLLFNENVIYVDEIENCPTAIINNFQSPIKKPDITILTYGGSSRFVQDILTKMQREEVNIQVILPSSITPIPVNTILKYTKESHKILIIEEGTKGFNWGSELSSLIYENNFENLSNPILRISSDNDIIPTSSIQEDAMLVSKEKIEMAIINSI